MGGAASSRGTRPNNDDQQQQQQQQQHQHRRPQMPLLHRDGHGQQQRDRHEQQQQQPSRALGEGASAGSSGTSRLFSTQQRREQSAVRGAGGDPDAGAMSIDHLGRLRMGSAATRPTDASRLSAPVAGSDAASSEGDFEECLLLLDDVQPEADSSVHAITRILSDSNSHADSISSGNGNKSSDSGAAAGLFREVPEEARSRFAAGRRQLERLQKLLQVAEETDHLPLSTREDWEDFADCLFGNFYCISRLFWRPRRAAANSRSCGVSPAGNSTSSNSSSSSSISSSNGSSSGEDDVCCIPVDLEAACRLHSRVVAAARHADGSFEPTALLLKSIERLCGKLLKAVSALQHPQQLAFIPVLLECPFLEDDVEFAALAKLCKVVAALPFKSRCIVSHWSAGSPNTGCCRCPPRWCVLLSGLRSWPCAVRLLTASPSDSSRSPQAASPFFAEASLRSAVLLLHLLYVANVRRQQQRLLLSHWRLQDLPSAGEYAFGVPTAAALQPDQQQQQQAEQQQLREIEYEAFQNDAINSNQQLLHSEFSMWLQLRRMPPFNRLGPHSLSRRSMRHIIQPVITLHSPRELQQQELQLEQQQQQQRQMQATGAPAAEDAQQAGEGEARPAVSGSPPAAAAASAEAAREGGEAAAAAAEEAGGGGGSERHQGLQAASARSMSVNSLLSPAAAADAVSSFDAEDAADIVIIPEGGNPETGQLSSSSSSGSGGGGLFGSNSLQNQLMRIFAAVREGREVSRVPPAGPPTDVLPEAPADAAGAASAAASGTGDSRPVPPEEAPAPDAAPLRMPSSRAAVAAAAAAANKPFNHYAVPRRGEGEEFLFTLLSHPFVFDAAAKADILRREASIEQELQARQSEVDAIVSMCTGGGLSYPLPFLYLQVRRSHLVQDTLQQIASNSSEGGRSSNANLRKALKVKFIGEEAVDQGGVAKEFFQLLVNELFSPDYGMFTLDEESQMQWFCGCSLESRFRFELIGILCGLAIHNSLLMPVRFPLALFKKLLGWPANSLEDLHQLHPQVAKQDRLSAASAAASASAAGLAAMGLTFSVATDFLGEQRETPLGSHDPSDKVTLDNREEFVELYIQHVLNSSVEAQYSAFESGFYRCVDSAALSFFRPEELQLLLLGKEEDLDVSLLQKAAVYEDGYTEASPAVGMFWRICSRLSQEQKQSLLMFITGSDRVPLGGAQALRLTIARSGPDTDRLPTAHTCFNFLLLPDYSSEEKMEQLPGLRPPLTVSGAPSFPAAARPQRRLLLNAALGDGCCTAGSNSW
ncbi:hypothetical protein Efla_001034 [Eimeria flavescens]